MTSGVSAHEAYQTLRADVATALAARGESSSKGGLTMGLKSAFLVLHWMLWFAAALGVGQFEPWLAVLLAPFVAASFTVIPLCIGHDGVHGAASEVGWLNRLASGALVAAGYSAIGWGREHVTGHHRHANVLGLDPDLETGGVLRFHEGQPWRPLHRYQHLYAWLVYAVVAARWMWYEDFDDLVNDRQQLRGRARARHFAEVMLAKLLHIAIFVALPVIALGPLPALVFYAIHSAVNSLLSASVFVVHHTTGQQAMPITSAELPTDLGLAQVATTSNFSPENRWLSWVLGGLNLQIEHHLFPAYSHLHLQWIRPIVREWAERNGVDYVEHPTFAAALRAHAAHLRRLGRPIVAG